MRVGLVVEGDGEMRAVPTLIARTGLELGLGSFAPRPIKAGNHVKLARPGEIERFALLAASQPGAQLVLILLDIDDDCAAQLKSDFEQRTNHLEARFGIPIRVCFCVREFECWFLECVVQLAASVPDFGWLNVDPVQDPHGIRGAKEKLQERFAKHYKPVSDQEKLVRGLDLPALYRSNRSFRRFVRALSGYEYADLDQHFFA